MSARRFMPELNWSAVTKEALGLGLGEEEEISLWLERKDA